MKKIISWGVMLAAAFTLTNCAKEIDAPVQEPESAGIPFEIVASTVDTKTVNDGMSTNWAEGDQINLFHAVTGTTKYINDTPYSDGKGHPFVISNVDKGLFTGNLSEELNVGVEYDWFALYPYSTYIKTPGQQTDGYTYIGGRSDTPQSQDGVDNMKHIAGKNYPLYGKATSVGAGNTPKLTMYHASTLLKVNVTNTLDTDLAVKSIAFTAPEGTSLVGTFYLDITGTEVVYADGKYVSNEAKLSVSNATIAPDQTASFYLAVKPFTAAVGTDLKISVNGYEKTLLMTKDVTFAAGKIKTLNFTYDKVETPVDPEEPKSITATLTFDSTDKRTEYSTSKQVWEENGIIFTNEKSSSTSNVADYAKPARLYANSKVLVEAPGDITEIVFDCNSSSYATAMKNSVGASATASSDKVTVSLDGSSNVFTVAKLTAQVRIDAVTVTYKLSNPDEAKIIVEPVTDVSARGVESATLTYEIANLEYDDLTVTCDGEVVESASKGDDGVINYTVSTNSTTSAREGVITITAGTLTKEVKVSQKAPVFTVSKTEVVLEADAEANLSVTVTSDFDWIAEASDNAGFTFTPDEYVWEENGKQSVKISAKAANDSEEGTITLGIITLTNLETNEMLTITVKQESSYVAAGSVTESISFASTTQRVSQDSNSQVWKNGGVTFTNEKASSSTAVGNYSNPVRLYQDSNVKISATGKITEVVIESDGTAKYKTALQNSLTGAGYTYTNSGNNYTITLTSPAEAVEFSLTAQARFKSLKVTYQN